MGELVPLLSQPACAGSEAPAPPLPRKGAPTVLLAATSDRTSDFQDGLPKWSFATRKVAFPSRRKSLGNREHDMKIRGETMALPASSLDRNDGTKIMTAPSPPGVGRGVSTNMEQRSSDEQVQEVAATEYAMATTLPIHSMSEQPGKTAFVISRQIQYVVVEVASSSQCTCGLRQACVGSDMGSLSSTVGNVPVEVSESRCERGATIMGKAPAARAETLERVEIGMSGATETLLSSDSVEKGNALKQEALSDNLEVGNGAGPCEQRNHSCKAWKKRGTKIAKRKEKRGACRKQRADDDSFMEACRGSNVVYDAKQAMFDQQDKEEAIFSLARNAVDLALASKSDPFEKLEELCRDEKFAYRVQVTAKVNAKFKPQRGYALADYTTEAFDEVKDEVVQTMANWLEKRAQETGNHSRSDGEEPSWDSDDDSEHLEVEELWEEVKALTAEYLTPTITPHEITRQICRDQRFSAKLEAIGCRAEIRNDDFFRNVVGNVQYLADLAVKQARQKDLREEKGRKMGSR